VNIHKNFVQDVFGEWYNMKYIHSFYIDCRWKKFIICARTMSGDLQLTDAYEDEDDAHDLLQKCMEGR
jgi:hypothetical protein